MFHMNIFIIKGERDFIFFGKVSLISDRTLYIYVYIFICLISFILILVKLKAKAYGYLVQKHK